MSKLKELYDTIPKNSNIDFINLILKSDFDLRILPTPELRSRPFTKRINAKGEIYLLTNVFEKVKRNEKGYLVTERLTAYNRHHKEWFLIEYQRQEDMSYV